MRCERLERPVDNRTLRENVPILKNIARILLAKKNPNTPVNKRCVHSTKKEKPRANRASCPPRGGVSRKTRITIDEGGGKEKQPFSEPGKTTKNLPYKTEGKEGGRSNEHREGEKHTQRRRRGKGGRAVLLGSM